MTDSIDQSANHDEYSDADKDLKTDNGELVNESIDSNCTDEVHFPFSILFK